MRAEVRPAASMRAAATDKLELEERLTCTTVARRKAVAAAEAAASQAAAAKRAVDDDRLAFATACEKLFEEFVVQKSGGSRLFILNKEGNEALLCRRRASSYGSRAP